MAKSLLRESESPSRASLKQRILRDIVAHLQIHGRTRWDLIRERPEYESLIGKVAGPSGKRTFFRWVDAVSAPTRPDVTRPHEAREAANDALAAATAKAREAARHLPCAPSPAYLMRGGAEAARNIDYLAEVHAIYADALRLRDEAMEPDEAAPDGKRITDPKIFERAIARRLDVISTVVRVMEQVFDLHHQQRFNKAVFDILVDELSEVPDLQKRVLSRLKELNVQHAMTIHAETL